MDNIMQKLKIPKPHENRILNMSSIKYQKNTEILLSVEEKAGKLIREIENENEGVSDV